MRPSVGPYRVLAELGEGGMGRVRLAGGPDGRLVAVKQIHARFAAEEGFRARFAREVVASGRVSGAYTAAVVDADPDAEEPWLASVYVPGPSLRQALDVTGPLPAEAVLRLAAGLAVALAGIHRAGLVHRDLKPSNVLLAEDGPRVIDFGIARLAEANPDGELTRTGWMVGTPEFVSPEQADSRVPSPASDVFSLGCVLAAACTGASPFAAESTLRTLTNIVGTEPDLGALPERLRPIVLACLAKDPAARPSAAQISELVGPLAPVTRPWPDAVNRMIADQRAWLDGLTSGLPSGTGPVPAGAWATDAPTTPSAPAWNGPPPWSGDRVPLPGPGARPRQSKRRTGLIAAIVAAALLVAGGGTVAAVLLTQDDTTTAVPSGPQRLVVRLTSGVTPARTQRVKHTLSASPGVRQVVFVTRAQAIAKGTPANAAFTSYQAEVTDQRAAQQAIAAVKGLPDVVSATAQPSSGPTR